MKQKKTIIDWKADYSDKFTEYLDNDESILWTGKKAIKSNLESRLLGLGMAAFAVLWMFIVYTSGKGLLAIIALPFAVLGAMMIFGVDSDHYYAVTDKRIISFVFKKPVSVYYEDVFEVDVKKETDDTGTVIIKSRNKILGVIGSDYTERIDYAKETMLEYVYNYMTAYRLINERAAKYDPDAGDMLEYKETPEQF